jgi:hypothetical protein
MKIAFALLSCPADIAIPVCHTPCRGSRAQSCQRQFGRTFVDSLRSVAARISVVIEEQTQEIQIVIADVPPQDEVGPQTAIEVLDQRTGERHVRHRLDDDSFNPMAPLSQCVLELGSTLPIGVAFCPSPVVLDREKSSIFIRSIHATCYPALNQANSIVSGSTGIGLIRPFVGRAPMAMIVERFDRAPLSAIRRAGCPRGSLLVQC